MIWINAEDAWSGINIPRAGGPNVEDERESPESRWVLRGLVIMMAVAGLALGLVTLLGHGIVGD